MHGKKSFTAIAAGLLVVAMAVTDAVAAPPLKAPRTIQFGGTTYEVTQGDPAAITVTRSASHGPASVTFATSDGTAKAGTDYTAVTTTVSFRSGQTTATVDVPTSDKAKLSYGAVTVTLTLSAPSRRWTLGDPGLATLTIDPLALPGAPTNLTAQLVTGSGDPYVALSWTAATGTVDHYEILSSTNTGGPYGEVGTSTATTYDVTPVPLVTTYFVVEAVNVSGLSDASNEATFVPAVVGHGLYWADFSGGRIMAANVDGTGVTTLVTGQTNPFGVAVDASHLYWSTDVSSRGGAIMEADLSGANPHALISGLNNPYGVAVDASHIYWTSYADSTIMEANLDGTGVTTLVSSTWEPAALAVDASHLYWTDTADNWIWTSNLDGSNAHKIVTTVNYPFAIAVGSSGIYWAVTGSNSGSDGAVWAAGLDGSNPTSLVPSQAHPDGIAVDASHLYWANANTGTIMSADLQGTGVTTLVSSQGIVAGVAVAQ